jgi:hypothetical protein
VKCQFPITNDPAERPENAGIGDGDDHYRQVAHTLSFTAPAAASGTY